MTAKSGSIHIGIGGWTFEPWRGLFYPKGLPHAKELAYAAERLTSIEINGTFYRAMRLHAPLCHEPVVRDLIEENTKRLTLTAASMTGR